MKSCGTFTISIDVELLFATTKYDQPIQPSYPPSIKPEREIVERILELFSKYDIPATWAIVGDLLSSESDWKGEYAKNYDDPLKYGRDITEWLKNTSPKQEIGSHSFGHISYNEASIDREVISTDIANVKKVHNAAGLPFETFIFPYNMVGYRDLLAKNGVSVYRGVSRRWYHSIPCRFIHRLLNLSSFLTAITPRTVTAMIDETGIVNIPDSMLLFSRQGYRSLVSSKKLIKIGLAGLNRAVERREIFHLWFHPSNFLYKTDEQFYVLEAILKHAQHLKENGQLEILTMSEIRNGITKTDGPVAVKTNVKKIRGEAITLHDKEANLFEDAYQLAEKDYFATSFTYGRKKLQVVLEQALQALPKGSSVLDIGCGTGEHLKRYHELGFNVTGIEPAEEMRLRAQEQNPTASILDGVITNLPFEDGSFDFISTIEVLRYLHRTDIQQAYHEMLRVLKPGGQLFFTMVNRFALNGFYVFDIFRKSLFHLLPHKEAAHCEFVTPKRVQRDLNKLGVKEITFQGPMFAPFIFTYRINPKLGARVARSLESFSDSLCQKKWMVPLSGCLVVIAKRPETVSAYNEN